MKSKTDGVERAGEPTEAALLTLVEKIGTPGTARKASDDPMAVCDLPQPTISQRVFSYV